MEIGPKQVKTEDKKIYSLHCGTPANYSLIFYCRDDFKFGRV